MIVWIDPRLSGGCSKGHGIVKCFVPKCVAEGKCVYSLQFGNLPLGKMLWE